VRWVAALVLAACQSARSPTPPAPDQARLLAARDLGDITTMRAHAWKLWAGIQNVWETWPRSDVVFGATDRIFRELQAIQIGDRIEVETSPLMFAVIFDPVAAKHVTDHRLAERTTLRGRTEIPAFPRDALTLKAIWYPIHHDRATPLPIWDGEPAHAEGNPSRTWKRQVIVDPSGAEEPTGGVVDELVDGVHRVPIDAFIHRPLTTRDEVLAAQRVAKDPTLAIGDHVILLGMHISTKEIPDWVWATVWWHDRPDEGPFALGRPASLHGAARSYLMDVTFSAIDPKGRPHAAMNPWLEARFPDGVRSNCVSCHRRAGFGTMEYLPVTHGDTAPSDPYFTDKVQTDMVWSLALEAR
jgi:hypothetical protein